MWPQHFFFFWKTFCSGLGRGALKALILFMYVSVYVCMYLSICLSKVKWNKNIKTPHFLFSETVCIFHDNCSPSPSVSFTGLEGMECSLPVDGRQVSLSELSEDSFRECRGLLTLTDYLIVIFSGICISVAAIIASFFLASTIHCFQRLKSKRTDEEEAEE